MIIANWRCWFVNIGLSRHAAADALHGTSCRGKGFSDERTSNLAEAPELNMICALSTQ
jgi:hypothetical protein